MLVTMAVAVVTVAVAVVTVIVAVLLVGAVSMAVVTLIVAVLLVAVLLVGVRLVGVVMGVALVSMLPVPAMGVGAVVVFALVLVAGRAGGAEAVIVPAVMPMIVTGRVATPFAVVVMPHVAKATPAPGQPTPSHRFSPTPNAAHGRNGSDGQLLAQELLGLRPRFGRRARVREHRRVVVVESVPGPLVVVELGE